MQLFLLCALCKEPKESYEKQRLLGKQNGHRMPSANQYITSPFNVFEVKHLGAISVQWIFHFVVVGLSFLHGFWWLCIPERIRTKTANFSMLLRSL